MSKFFEHVTKLYNLLDEEAEDGVFIGSQQKVFDKIGLSNAYNPRLYSCLRDLGCIEMMQRGAGLRPTKLRLVKPPQIEAFDQWTVDRAPDLTRRVSLSNIEASLRLLERRLPQGVDLSNWILGIEQRMAVIEQQLGIDR